jgi:hypothetical protein
MNLKLEQIVSKLNRGLRIDIFKPQNVENLVLIDE